MRLRVLLVGLILAATAAFVVGVSIERGDEAAHHAEATEVGPSTLNREGEGGEATHAERGASAEAAHEELRPLGVDIEAWPFVAAAALASLALAAVALLNPKRSFLLTLVAAVMLAFAALDIREVFHQVDIDEGGLAVLAAAVAALHLAAALVAGAMSSQRRHAAAAPPGTMPA